MLCCAGPGSMPRSEQWAVASPLNMVHSYVNIVDRADQAEDTAKPDTKPALPARNSKTRSKSGSRSSRSKERKEREVSCDWRRRWSRDALLISDWSRRGQTTSVSRSGRRSWSGSTAAAAS